MDINVLLLILIFLSLPEAISAEKKKLRLVNGGSPCAGRVELYHSGQWGTVYSYNWDIQDAAVVCKQLECGSAVAAPINAHFGAGTGPVWMDEVQCQGGEAALWDCQSPGLRQHGYSHTWDAGVTCSGKQKGEGPGMISPEERGNILKKLLCTVKNGQHMDMPDTKMQDYGGE
ncbi:scavenger receptor cysteine-rich type 1 protein M130-like [Protopterus annectens]|uniref:scavenger receptor cysteine-rich type 1 protein M130-like n=1 Tax=Protopterus annectens TaxID=7888 RepID=UPI001CF99AC5|nr:scavenger receptor cysteine-rich type 1 protein M130-like [Protopterus annectens]